MSQHEKSKEVVEMNLKKNELCRARSRYPVVFPFVNNRNIWTSVFYPAMLENEEDNIIKLPLHDHYHVRFGP